MLILAKLVGIFTLVWFYLTAKKLGEPAVKWAIIGLIGYWISWWLVNRLFLVTLTKFMASSSIGTFLVTQIPVIGAFVVVIFVRKKLISSAETANK